MKKPSYFLKVICLFFSGTLIAGCSVFMTNIGNSQTMNVNFVSNSQTTVRCLKTGAKINGFILDDSQLTDEGKLFLTKQNMNSAISIMVTESLNGTGLRVRFDNRDNILIDGWNKAIRYCRSTIP